MLHTSVYKSAIELVLNYMTHAYILYLVCTCTVTPQFTTEGSEEEQSSVEYGGDQWSAGLLEEYCDCYAWYHLSGTG